MGNYLKFLYDAFLPEYWWTEVMECLRKLLLTGFVVFFYAGSALQIFASLVVSMVFLVIYTDIKPYLMPSNNTFAMFVHFQVAFTLACTLLLRMMEYASSGSAGEAQVDSDSMSWALLISNASVILIGAILIGKSCFDTSERDFLDAGFDENFKRAHSADEEERKEERRESKEGSGDSEIGFTKKGGNKKEEKKKETVLTDEDDIDFAFSAQSFTKGASKDIEMTSQAEKKDADEGNENGKKKKVKKVKKKKKKKKATSTATSLDI